jgi:resuscitation-promoting factor RpfB
LPVRPTRLRRLRIHRATQAATLAAGLAVAGALLYIVAQTHVILVVAGRPEAISTNSQNVRQLLETQGITLSSSLRVVPPPATALVDGMLVVVSPAPDRPGASSTLGSTSVGLEGTTANPAPTGVGVWVMDGASSGPAAQIAAELAETSVSPGSVGTSPVVSVRAVVAGKVHDVLTNARTAGELLSAMGITPDASDRVRPSPSTPLHVGSDVIFDRVEVRTREVLRAIPFRTLTTWTTALAPGQVRVISRGITGLSQLTERVVVVDGKVTSRTRLAESMIRPPIAEVREAGPASPTLPIGAVAAGVATGQATWYDPPWTGLTAASPWIPFGTQVRVTDLDTGRTVIVVIDDRGPFAPGRIIDLSPEAFSALSPLGRGVLDVRISW